MIRDHKLGMQLPSPAVQGSGVVVDARTFRGRPPLPESLGELFDDFPSSPVVALVAKDVENQSHCQSGRCVKMLRDSAEDITPGSRHIAGYPECVFGRGEQLFEDITGVAAGAGFRTGPKRVAAASPGG